MTKGSLTISIKGDKTSKVYFYTYHDGMDIPDILDKAIEVRGKYVMSWVGLFNPPTTMKALEKSISMGALADGIENPPTIASWAIAAKPCFLEPAKKDDMDSGYHYNLIINEEDTTWELYGEDEDMGKYKLLRSLDYSEVFKSKLAKMLKIND